MNSGFVGVLGFLGTAAAIYFGSTYLDSYFAQRNAQTPVVVEAEVEEAVPQTAPGSDPQETATLATGAEETVTQETAADVSGTGETATPLAIAPEAAVEQASPAQSSEARPASLEENPAAGSPETAEPAEPAEPAQPATVPTLDIVRIEPDGEVLIAGNAPQGERVGLIYNNELVAEAEVEAGGDFVLVPEQALPAGEGTLGVVVLDQNGQPAVQSEEQVAVVLPQEGSTEGFLVGVLRPGQPVDIIEREAPAGATSAPATEPAALQSGETADETAADADGESIATVPPVADGTALAEAPDVAAAEITTPEPFVMIDAIELEGQDIWIAGAALPGTTIRLYQDNALLGEVVTGEEGRFLFEGTLREAIGDVVVRADVLVAGSADVLARAEVPFQMPELEVALDPQPADPAPAAASEAAPALDEVAIPTPAPEPSTAPTRAPETRPAVEVAATPAPTLAPAPTLVPASPNTSANDGGRVAVLDTGRVIIRRGDNLWRLSRRVYGLGVRYTSIYDANRDQIRDAALIFPGQVFDLPQPDAQWGDVPGVDALEPDQIAGPQTVGIEPPTQ